MELKVQALLEQLIDDGIKLALFTADQLDSYERQELAKQLHKEIWLQLDTFFDFE